MKITMLEPLAVSKEEVDAYGLEIEYCGSTLTEAEMVERAKNADVLIMANAILPNSVIENTTAKLISVGFTGVDHLPLQLCKNKGITVCNASNYCTNSVAELAVGLMIALLRKVISSNEATRLGSTRQGLMGSDLAGKTVGVVGTGQIGSKVAKILTAFDANVIAYSRTQKYDFNYVDLNTLMENSDIITLHLPLTSETNNIIDKRRIALMKPSALLVNVARGGILDTKALAEALNTGKIAAAGIDVYETEPPLPLDHPLLSAKNCILTPHIAFATQEAMKRRLQIVIQNIENFSAGTPTNVIQM